MKKFVVGGLLLVSAVAHATERREAWLYKRHVDNSKTVWCQPNDEYVAVYGYQCPLQSDGRHGTYPMSMVPVYKTNADGSVQEGLKVSCMGTADPAPKFIEIKCAYWDCISMSRSTCDYQAPRTADEIDPNHR